ncbi:hydroxyacid dehydrogenase [Streptomyces sp. SID4931]|nr:hydroxyacid dehydrogenase [Streptomyces sp. SID4931]SCG09357.1 Phosphoglycerate dehydrogenase [Streptomyces sp. Ncost-T6T-2b]
MTRISVLPHPLPDPVRAAVEQAPCVLAAPDEAEALIWTGSDPQALTAQLAAMPAVRWVQLPWAGVEEYLPLMSSTVQWTSARGVLAEPVAEHALMLSMLALRRADRSVRAGRWLPQEPRTLYDAEIVVVGAGAVTTQLLRLLAPLRARITVVRRRPQEAVEGAYRVVGADRLTEAVGGADLVIVAAALTARTRGLIDATVLKAMRTDACLVNVARGGLVGTDDLATALDAGWIAGAALDVTAPEPLPEAHPLWRADNCFITAHCAGDLPYSWPAFAELVRDNIERFAHGRALRNTVSRELGY